MSIGRWHYGKIVLVWAWGIALSSLGLVVLQMLSGQRYVLGTLLILAIAAVPVGLSTVTWKWLSGKEDRATPPTGGAEDGPPPGPGSELQARLQELARARGVTPEALAAEAVDEYLTRQGVEEEASGAG